MKGALWDEKGGIFSADMAAESLKLIPDDAGTDHPSVKNVQSKIAVLKAWAEKTGKKEYALFAEDLTNSLPKK